MNGVRYVWQEATSYVRTLSNEYRHCSLLVRVAYVLSYENRMQAR